MVYTGKTLYKGVSSGDNRKVLENTGLSLSQLPATNPTMLPVLTLHLDIDRTVELVMRGAPQWWPSKEQKVRDVLECNDATYNNEDNPDFQRKCRKLDIASPIFPYSVDVEDGVAEISNAEDQAITLVPGEVYVLDVILNFQPQYHEDMFGTRTLKTFVMSLNSVKGYKTALSFEHRNEARFRVKFTLNNNARALLVRPVMPWLLLLAQMGAWMGLWGMTGFLLSTCFKQLKLWGHVGPDDPGLLMDSLQEMHDRKCELMRKKAARKLKANLENEYRQYNIKVDIEKVAALLVDPPSTKGLLQSVRLVDVLKEHDPNAGLHDHITSVLGEVRLQMNKDDDSELEDDAELEVLTAQESMKTGKSMLDKCVIC